MIARLNALPRTAALLFVTLLLSACGGGSPSDPEENGLRPGSYLIAMEVYEQIGTVDAVLGRHRIVFRVNSPGSSSADFEVTSSERIPPEGPIERNYIAIDPERTEVGPQQWIVRFRSNDGDYEMRFTVRNAGYGDFQITSGCSVRQDDGGLVLSASGCVLDRV